jgi:hypothetical protein
MKFLDFTTVSVNMRLPHHFSNKCLLSLIAIPLRYDDAIASTALALGAGCNEKQEQHVHLSSLEKTATLRRGLGGEPGILDPGAAADSFSQEVLDDLYEGLTTESADGTVVPGGAASRSVDPTGTRYEFYLRHDARWSNGAPVRAALPDPRAAWFRQWSTARSNNPPHKRARNFNRVSDTVEPQNSVDRAPGISNASLAPAAIVAGPFDCSKIKAG